MGVVFVGSVVRDAVLVVVVVSAFLLAYYLAYSLSFTYLRPYMNYYWNVSSSHARVFNLPMLIILASSPFNAYETKLIHTNSTVYFLNSVLLPAVSLLALLLFYELVMLMFRVRPGIELVGFVMFVLPTSLADSWLTSLIRWLWLGVPSIGTSIFTVFQVIAASYVSMRLAGAIRLMRDWPRPLRDVTYVFAIIVIVLVDVAIFIRYIPIADRNHIIGLLIAVALISIYHKCSRFKARASQ